MQSGGKALVKEKWSLFKVLMYLKREMKSQKHRVAEAGRSSGVTPLLKQGHLKPVAQEHGENGFLF